MCLLQPNPATYDGPSEWILVKEPELCLGADFVFPDNTAFSAAYLWQLDPPSKVPEAFPRQEAGSLLTDMYSAEAMASAQHFDAVTLPLGQLWPVYPTTDR